MGYLDGSWQGAAVGVESSRLGREVVFVLRAAGEKAHWISAFLEDSKS